MRILSTLLIAILCHGSVLAQELQEKKVLNIAKRELNETIADFKKRKWHISDFQVNVVNNSQFYNVIFQRVPGKTKFTSLVSDIKDADLAEKLSKDAATGWHMKIVRPYVVHKRPYHAILYVYAATKNPLQEFWKARKMVSTGKEISELDAFDDLMEQTLVKHRIPGAQLAVAKDGVMIYSRGFGYADIDQKKRVNEKDTLFRLCGLSKPITGAAVAYLIQEGKLKLDLKVTSLVDLKPFPDNAQMDPNYKKMTLSHLLTHESGFTMEDHDKYMYATRGPAHDMGLEPPLNANNTLRNIVAKSLAFEPGTRRSFAHSNYVMLGRLIEVAGNEPYEKFVQNKVLRPLGIRRMKIGQGPVEFKNKKETFYFTQKGKHSQSDVHKRAIQVPSQYRFNLAARDATQGWIGTARDYLKFAIAADPSAENSVLDQETRAFMLKRPSKLTKDPDAFQSFGWRCHFKPKKSVPRVSVNGRFNGSCAQCERQVRGITFVVLFNCMTTKSGKLIDQVFIPEMNKAIDSIKQWPTREIK